MNDTTMSAPQMVAAAYAATCPGLCRDKQADGHCLTWFILGQTNIRSFAAFPISHDDLI
ncbi:hypothetical protein [Hymenobacter yonginensis]|uniref:Uncharacterized protein n=1 Tax=Hymenobacter yonginensis TaxID=748197 RepID=A0ABY7PKJ9_9BACT|nr:hypothetical protein [Hymenobacter yonginensis]WBO83732.1 hypothetical protein O9Z63_15285 [Hymenobacter yonginensis]